MSCGKVLFNILCALALVGLPLGCTKNTEDEAFVFEDEEEEDPVDSNRVIVEREPRKVEIIVPEPEPVIEQPAEVAAPVAPAAPMLPFPPPPPPLVPVPLPLDPGDDGDFEDDGDEDGHDEDDGHERECRRDSDCHDENFCTDDNCSDDGECEHTNNTDSCDDGNACTQNDRCASGECAGTPPSTDEDDDECSNGRDDDCDGNIDCADIGCLGEECIDRNSCTQDDICTNGQCVGTDVDLTVGQVTYDFCSTITGCTYVLCDDGFVGCAQPTKMPNGTPCLPNADDCEAYPDNCGCPGSDCTDGSECFNGFCAPVTF